jgi:hypothetical protein
MAVDDVLAEPESRELSTELAALVLSQAAPEELPVLDETADEFFSDPDAVLDPRRRDEALGFGIEVALLAPYVLAAVVPVVKFLGSLVAESVGAEVRPRLGALVGRLFRRVPGSGPASPGDDLPPLTRDQARHVRDLAYSRAAEAGLPPDRAGFLADSVVGALIVGG